MDFCAVCCVIKGWYDNSFITCKDSCKDSVLHLHTMLYRLRSCAFIILMNLYVFILGFLCISCAQTFGRNIRATYLLNIAFFFKSVAQCDNCFPFFLTVYC